jgi:PAS domain S-box-containing protein
MRILHLEDSANDAELMARLIRDEWAECEIQRTSQAGEFEAALARSDFDLILSDYTMPGFDGLTALKLAHERCPHKPFIFLSGTIGEDRAVEALKNGAADYVIKDRPNRLVPAIKQAIGRMREEESHRQAQEFLRQHEQRLKEHASLLDLAHDAICTITTDHNVSCWNAAAEHLYGWSAAEAVGHNIRTLIFQRDPGRYLEVFEKVMTNRAWQGEMSHCRKTGESIAVDSRWTLVPDASGAPRSILLINSDASERKRQDARLLQTQRLESIVTLSHGIAHDLNNVFTPILMAVEMLQQYLTDDAARQLLATVEKSSQQGAGLIRQLVVFARGSTARRAKLRVGAMLTELANLMRETLPDTIELEVHCADDAWPVNADATQISQALTNLCVNARDAMPAGGRITIAAGNMVISADSAQMFADGRAGKFLCLTVTDTGTGIPPLILDKIFDPFFTTKEVGKGVGLGLSALRGIVRSHEGFIHIDTALGQGTVFQIYLPALDEPADQPPTAADHQIKFRGNGEVILVIDDDSAVRSVLGVLLDKAGYRVLAAADGQAGLDLYHSRPGEIALVLTDMMMPGLTGAEVIQALRTVNPQIPIIAMSGLLDAGVLKEDVDLDRLEFLPKPLNARLLLAAIHRRLNAPLPV